MMRKHSGMDDPLRIQDMKVPPSVYSRRFSQGGLGTGSLGPGASQRPQRMMTLGRVSNTSRVQLRRKNAVTSDADESFRLRSLSAEEKRIMDKIRGGTAGGSGGSSADCTDGRAAYQELNRSVRLTFTGNMAISCGNLAVNQARARRALESAKRPPGSSKSGTITTCRARKSTPGSSRRRMASSSGGRHRSMSSSKGGSHGRGGTTDGRREDRLSRGASKERSSKGKKVGASKPGDPSVSQQYTGSLSQQQQQQQQQQQAYSRETSVVKEMHNSGDTPDCQSTRTISSSCSPAVAAPDGPVATPRLLLEQRGGGGSGGGGSGGVRDHRSANPQAVDAMTSLSSWVSTGSALLRQITAARDGIANPVSNDVRYASQQQLLQQQEQQRLQHLTEDWDPAEVNVSRLIRRRHLEALLSNGASPDLVERLLD